MKFVIGIATATAFISVAPVARAQEGLPLKKSRPFCCHYRRRRRSRRLCPIRARA